MGEAMHPLVAVIDRAGEVSPGDIVMIEAATGRRMLARVMPGGDLEASTPDATMTFTPQSVKVLGGVKYLARTRELLTAALAARNEQP